MVAASLVPVVAFNTIAGPGPRFGSEADGTASIDLGAETTDARPPHEGDPELGACRVEAITAAIESSALAIVLRLRSGASLPCTGSVSLARRDCGSAGCFLETFEVVRFVVDNAPPSRQIVVAGGSCTPNAGSSPIEVVWWRDALASVVHCEAD